MPPAIMAARYLHGSKVPIRRSVRPDQNEAAIQLASQTIQMKSMISFGPKVTCKLSSSDGGEVLAQRELWGQNSLLTDAAAPNDWIPPMTEATMSRNAGSMGRGA